MPLAHFEDILTQPWGIKEGLELEDYVIGTFFTRLGKKQSGLAMGQFAGVEQSTGTWIRVPAETAEVRKNHIAKLIGCHELPNWEYELPKTIEYRDYVMQIAWPKINLVNTEGKLNFALLFTALIGNISMGGKIKLLDMWFPKDILATMPGPRFGIEGVRKYLGVEKRPLLNNMIKPCTGHTAEVAGELAYKVALGGVDVVKDDELIADQKFNTLEDRVTKVMEGLDKAKEETGEKTIYMVNVTDNTPRIFRNIDVVQKHGGNGMLINYLPQGLTAVQQVAEDPSVKLPIQGHMDFSGVWYEDPFTGVTSKLTLGKLPRLVGCDIIVLPAPYGKAPVVPERFIQNVMECVYPLPHIKPMMPMPSGGITPGMVEYATRDLGFNIMLGAGGGIHSHQDGPTAGAIAFRQAITAAMEGIPVKTYAKDHKELGISLGMWGQKKTGM
ncbi:RuBisCO large subunit C-terminal-like domain-containing protein [Promethearchaeum syntrophicum]|uniref:RuBisCO large subunit C-terminal-like domain-containing protein n=1 Tax=Promethearchaeum syntrophicum TaxID=2594042 RepID=A0A5B9DCV6_9ARCH|nr:RuBisCO large subunit C-terminal-like domain-containing protein [Candidatus Prometheoarchaeum syntrophicum]QEE17139.1 Ribulose bisphosphate carboxylase [Candidatus Prometheoarchaeum syntrophicum]